MRIAQLIATEVATESAIPPVAYGLVSFAALITLLLVTYAFRSVGTRH